jgi:hypothetical protein
MQQTAVAGLQVWLLQMSEMEGRVSFVQAPEASLIRLATAAAWRIEHLAHPQMPVDLPVTRDDDGVKEANG